MENQLSVADNIFLIKANKIMTGDLNDTQMRNVLTSQALGRLACVSKNHPYIVPITYHYDGKYIYGQSNPGRKIRMLRKNPNLCFEVDVMTAMNNWQCILVFGKFEELKKEKADKARDILSNSLYSLMTSSTIHPHQHKVLTNVDDSNRIKPVMFRIRIKKITGRFEKP